ncbi:hypothetical protein EMIT0158MI4_100336 [Burkholderia ambifaria]
MRMMVRLRAQLIGGAAAKMPEWSEITDSRRLDRLEITDFVRSEQCGVVVHATESRCAVTMFHSCEIG